MKRERIVRASWIDDEKNIVVPKKKGSWEHLEQKNSTIRWCICIWWCRYFLASVNFGPYCFIFAASRTPNRSGKVSLPVAVVESSSPTLSCSPHWQNLFHCYPPAIQLRHTSSLPQPITAATPVIGSITIVGESVIRPSPPNLSTVVAQFVRRLHG